MKKIYLLAAIALMGQLSFGAELFIRVARPGSHTATAYNQMQANTTNIFRFFELPGGNTAVRISDQQNGYDVFNGFLAIGSNQRIVAELDYNGNLQILQTTVVSSSNWYTSHPGNVVYNPNPNNGYPNVNTGQWGGTDDAAFGQFLNLMDDEPFDSNKLDLARSYAKKTNLSARQIADISRKFTFDSNRLDWAKGAYSSCYDKANYFLLKSTFTFSTNYSALEEYIEGQ